MKIYGYNKNIKGLAVFGVNCDESVSKNVRNLKMIEYEMQSQFLLERWKWNRKAPFSFTKLFTEFTKMCSR